MNLDVWQGKDLWGPFSDVWQIQELGVEGLNLGDRTRLHPPPPLFFVSADCKVVAGDGSVSADSAGVKVADFSVSWKWLGSADSKGVTDAFCLLEDKQPASADPKGLNDREQVGACR
jgi:hypothetical protein